MWTIAAVIAVGANIDDRWLDNLRKCAKFQTAKRKYANISFPDSLHKLTLSMPLELFKISTYLTSKSQLNAYIANPIIWVFSLVMDKNASIDDKQYMTKRSRFSKVRNWVIARYPKNNPEIAWDELTNMSIRCKCLK